MANSHHAHHASISAILIVYYRLQVGILLIRQRHLSGLDHFPVVLLHDCLVDLNLGRSKGWLGDEFLLES